MAYKGAMGAPGSLAGVFQNVGSMLYPNAIGQNLLPSGTEQQTSLGRSSLGPSRVVGRKGLGTGSKNDDQGVGFGGGMFGGGGSWR